jgi:4-hydroxy-2-oxoheptanedioate aldolase
VDEVLSANRIRQRWSTGQPAIVAWLQIPSAHHAELLATLGFDGLVVDFQHSLIDFRAAVEMFTAIDGKWCEPLVRVSQNDFTEIGRLLDAGASCIIAPLIDTADAAQALVNAIHYPPNGSRSLGPRRPVLRWGQDYRIRTRDLLVSLAMVETRAALDNLEAILAVPNLDGLFIGPSDLALALGREPAADPTDPVVLDAIRHVRESAHAAGKRIGIFCGSAESARERIREGFDLVSIGTDLQMLAGAAKTGLSHVRE